MAKDIIITIMAILLMGLIMGKAIVSAVSHVLAWIMTRLAEMGTFNVTPKEDYVKFYMEHSGTPDIEH